MKRSRIRKLILLISLLLFPVTLNYLSPYLIVNGAFAGIVSGSFIIFSALFISSLFFGRAYCGWVCPGGALGECAAAVNNRPVGKKQDKVKYFIWAPWIIAIIAGFILAGGINRVDPLYLTDHGISVSAPENYIVFYFVIILILGTSLIFGRRSFCHSLCWMAPFIIIGNRLKNKLGYPSLGLEADSARCIDCKSCDKNCQMSLKVSEMVKHNVMVNDECILCGNCQVVCPQNVIRLGWIHKR